MSGVPYNTEITVTCPTCSRQFQETLGRLKDNLGTVCPGCGGTIEVKFEGREDLDPANDDTADFQRPLTTSSAWVSPSSTNEYDICILDAPFFAVNFQQGDLPMNVNLEAIEGSEVAARFDTLARKILSVPHGKIMRREADYNRQSAMNTNLRGPNPKIDPANPAVQTLLLPL